jgi:hypothetical protein
MMMAVPARASNQKWCTCLWKTGRNRGKTYSMSILFLSILLATTLAAPTAQSPLEKPLGDEEHEREELGVNPYTAPSIGRIFAQLDELKPLPFEQLKRNFPPAMAVSREQKGLTFGGLIADGFLIVESEKKNLVEDLGRVLVREARALGVADRVMRHSASLAELGRRGDWASVRNELIATQADVEQAMVELRDQKLAHLVSLGGWLRGLEISSGAVAADFSAQRAKVLAQPDLVNYFMAELKTLPPTIVHTPLFEKIRKGVDAIGATLSKASDKLTLVDVQAIQAQARELNLAIRRVE